MQIFSAQRRETGSQAYWKYVKYAAAQGNNMSLVKRKRQTLEGKYRWDVLQKAEKIENCVVSI